MSDDTDATGWVLGGSLDILPKQMKDEIVELVMQAMTSFEKEFGWCFDGSEDAEGHLLHYCGAPAKEVPLDDTFWKYDAPINIAVSPAVFMAAIDNYVDDWLPGGRSDRIRTADKANLLELLDRWRKGIEAAIDRAKGLPSEGALQ